MEKLVPNVPLILGEICFTNNYWTKVSHLVPLLPLLADDVGVVAVGVVAGAATVGVVGVATVCVCSCVVFFLLLLGRMAWMTHTQTHRQVGVSHDVLG